mgnify:CR=1 FL=1
MVAKSLNQEDVMGLVRKDKVFSIGSLSTVNRYNVFWTAGTVLANFIRRGNIPYTLTPWGKKDGNAGLIKPAITHMRFRVEPSQAPCHSSYNINTRVFPIATEQFQSPGYIQKDKPYELGNKLTVVRLCVTEFGLYVFEIYEIEIVRDHSSKVIAPLQEKVLSVLYENVSYYPPCNNKLSPVVKTQFWWFIKHRPEFLESILRGMKEFMYKETKILEESLTEARKAHNKVEAITSLFFRR